MQILIHVILASSVVAGGVESRNPVRLSDRARRAGKPTLQIERGPDLTVSSVLGIGNYGSENGISAFSIGSTACNVGDVPVFYEAATNEHPVIAQHMYRLEDGRFEQIGLSWVAQTFFALRGIQCGGCIDPCPSDGGTCPAGSRLGVGCSNPEPATIMGAQSLLGPRFEVNGFTGFFEYPPGNPPFSETIARRLQVHNADLDPALNPDAMYFVEVHYVTPDDAAAGNGHNNASHKVVQILPEDGVACILSGEANGYCAVATGLTQTGRPAIRAWKQLDPSVVETNVRVPGEGLFILATKASDLGDGFWHYEYALHNMNSDRAGQAFSVPLPWGAIVENAGFHDVDYHSGDPFDLTDWPAIVSDDAITWATTAYDVNPNANALRWGTLYNFRFDANVEPGRTTVTLSLFKAGQPEDVTVPTTGPSLSP